MKEEIKFTKEHHFVNQEVRWHRWMMQGEYKDQNVQKRKILVSNIVMEIRKTLLKKSSTEYRPPFGLVTSMHASEHIVLWFNSQQRLHDWMQCTRHRETAVALSGCEYCNWWQTEVPHQKYAQLIKPRSMSKSPRTVAKGLFAWSTAPYGSDSWTIEHLRKEDWKVGNIML